MLFILISSGDLKDFFLNKKSFFFVSTGFSSKIVSPHDFSCAVNNFHCSCKCNCCPLLLTFFFCLCCIASGAKLRFVSVSIFANYKSYGLILDPALSQKKRENKLILLMWSRFDLVLMCYFRTRPQTQLPGQVS